MLNVTFIRVHIIWHVPGTWYLLVRAELHLQASVSGAAAFSVALFVQEDSEPCTRTGTQPVFVVVVASMKLRVYLELSSTSQEQARL